MNIDAGAWSHHHFTAICKVVINFVLIATITKTRPRNDNFFIITCLINRPPFSLSLFRSLCVTLRHSVFRNGSLIAKIHLPRKPPFSLLITAKRSGINSVLTMTLKNGTEFVEEQGEKEGEVWIEKVLLIGVRLRSLFESCNSTERGTSRPPPRWMNIINVPWIIQVIY